MRRLTNRCSGLPQVSSFLHAQKVITYINRGASTQCFLKPGQKYPYTDQLYFSVEPTCQTYYIPCKLKESIYQSLGAQIRRHERGNTTCWKDYRRSIRSWSMCILDYRNMDTYPGASVVWYRFCCSTVNGDASNHSRYRLGPWARHYANSAVLCVLFSDWFFPAWGTRLGAGDWRPKFGLPDRRAGSMANAARDRKT